MERIILDMDEACMRFKIGLVLLLLAAPFAVFADVDTRYLQGLGDVRYELFESEIVGRAYHTFVMLPDGYEAAGDKRYPTIYILDGGNLFPMLVPYYGYLGFGEEVPDAIIVGISYGSDSIKDGNYRSTDYTAAAAERDYWGGAGTFQSFLGKELMPYIEDNYRSRADRRVVFGQSIGGQFVLYTALTQANLFWGHIASNPALHRNLPFFLRNHGEATAEKSRLFVASASNDEPRFRAPALQWIKHWTTENELPWELQTATLDGHSHMSAPPAAFRQGMRWLFSSE
jgi:predicted alpha/beta superfamily hydrolase